MTTTATSTRSRRAATTAAAASTTVDQYDHVAAATDLMKHAGTTALAVLDGQRPGQPIGCITDADIAAATAQGQDLNQTRIRDLIAHGHAQVTRSPAGHAPSCRSFADQGHT